MLSGPSVQTWLAWIQGKSAMRSALNQEHVPLPPIVSTQASYHIVVGHMLIQYRTLILYYSLVEVSDFHFPSSCC